MIYIDFRIWQLTKTPNGKAADSYANYFLERMLTNSYYSGYFNQKAWTFYCQLILKSSRFSISLKFATINTSSHASIFIYPSRSQILPFQLFLLIFISISLFWVALDPFIGVNLIRNILTASKYFTRGDVCVESARTDADVSHPSLVKCAVKRCTIRSGTNNFDACSYSLRAE